jgi:hypothetical protein
MGMKVTNSKTRLYHEDKEFTNEMFEAGGNMSKGWRS